jgi:hypothetical protein
MDAPSWRAGAPAIAARAAWGAVSHVAAFMHRRPGARTAARRPRRGNEQCVALVRRVAGISQGVTAWRRGVRATAARLPVGTPVATFLNRNGTPSDRYDGGGGVGAPGNNTTHAGIVAGYDERGGLRLLEQWVGSGGPRLTTYAPGDVRGGEKDARNYFSINDAAGRPLGSNNPLAGGAPNGAIALVGGEGSRRIALGVLPRSVFVAFAAAPEKGEIHARADRRAWGGRFSLAHRHHGRHRRVAAPPRFA